MESPAERQNLPTSGSWKAGTDTTYQCPSTTTDGIRENTHQDITRKRDEKLGMNADTAERYMDILAKKLLAALEEQGFDTRTLRIENRVKGAIIVSLVLLGVPSFIQLLDFSMVANNPAARGAYLQSLALELPNISSNGSMLVFILIMSNGLLGVLLSLGGVLIVMGRKNWGTEIASIALVVKLVALNLLLFYIQQFATIITAGYQFIILQGIYFYQRKYVKKPLAK